MARAGNRAPSTNLGKPRVKNDLLRHLINDFRDISLKSFLGHSDIIGRSYLYLIQNFAESAGKKGGEFFTPPKVSELLAKLIEPKEGDKIYDPACGTGSLLIKACREIKGRNFALYGQESNGGTWALAKMNMFLHGITGSYIEWGDTIRSPHFLDKKAVMQFNKDMRQGKKDVLFISGSRNFEKGKKQNKLRDKDIQKILRAYKKRKTLKRYAYLAGLKEIRDNEYNLNIPRYVETFEEEEAVDIRQVKKEIKGLENQLNQVRQKMNHHLNKLGI